MVEIILTNGCIVEQERVLDPATVVMSGDQILDVLNRCVATGPGVVDVGGRLVLPGLVDLHDDALEKEVNPRPNANFDPAMALLSLDRRLAAAGVTTQYHGVSFAEQPEMGRTLAGATVTCQAIHALRNTTSSCVEHHVLHRLELRTPSALVALFGSLGDEPSPLVSLDDHAPGRGKMADPAIYRAYLRRYLPRELSEADVDDHIQRVWAETAATEPLVTESLHALTTYRREHRLRLASHDDDTIERVDALHAIGCDISEFPLTQAAAERARTLGMKVVMGAPNVLRGGSLTGHASALGLLERDLLDILVADYHPPALLPATFRIVELGLRDLPGAVQLVTSAPASAAGLRDRGAISAGHRADLIVLDDHGRWPAVSALWRQGQLRYATGTLLDVLVAQS